ncbi:MAG: cadherin-like beta sandwich domain-containing protein, partial [Aphanocapsa feldmannii 277cV]
AKLSALALSSGSLAPLFDADRTSYSASVANEVESVTVTPTTINSKATVTVNGTALSSGNASDAI